MNTIIKQASFISIALGEQKIDPTKKYRLLNFLVFTDLEDGHLIYNVLTKELILINDEEYSLINNENIVCSDFINELIKSYYIVPQEFDEVKLFQQVKSLYRLFDSDDSITSYIILSTTDCNARCFYCCEQGQKRINMTEQTAIDTAKFIVKKSKGKAISIMWFGGEPLYNVKPINIITDYLRKNKIEFKSKMVSNAYLFDNDIIQLAKNKWNLKSVQITLDGTEDIYNKTKAYIYKECVNPFKKVISNIHLLSQSGIRVIIRLNMDLFNKDNLYELVDLLHTEFSDNSNVRIYIRVLFDNTSTVQINRSNDDRKMLYEEFMKFEDYIESKGMYNAQRLSSTYTEAGCIGTSKHGTVIMPGGELGMCDLHTDSDIYGNIYDDVTDQSVIDGFMVYKEPVKACDTCPLLPNCSRLKKCIYYIRDCEEYEQQRLLHQLKKHIVHTYCVWKEKNK